MTRQAAVVGGLLLLSIAISGTVFVLIWQSLTRDRIEREVVETRARVERYIARERWNDAKSVLESVADSDFAAEESWIPFIEQARRVDAEREASERETRPLSTRVAGWAIESVPDSGQLRAIYALLLLEAGQNRDAAEQAGFLAADKFASIHAALWLRDETERMPEGDFPSVHVVKSIADTDYSSLESVWRSTRSLPFGNNAVLEALAAGEREKAVRLLDELPQSDRTAELNFLVEVEAALSGDYDAIGEAERWLTRIPSNSQGRPSLLLARADLAALQQDSSKRELLLADAAAAAPRYSAVPYLGLSELSQNSAEAIKWLRQGWDVRQNDVRIALNLAASLRARGDYDSSLEVLSRTEDALEEQEDARLAFARVRWNPRISAERRRTALWQLLERFPESEPLAAELTARTARSGDRTGLEILRSHMGVQNSAWRSGLHAALAVASNDTEGAVAAYEESEPRGWRDQYNFGLALLSDRRYGSAFNAFETALENAQTEGAASEHVASVYLRAGETSLLRGNGKKARELAGGALEYDPSSARARMLWRVTGD